MITRFQKIIQISAFLFLCLSLSACGDMDRTSEEKKANVTEIIEEGEQMNNAPWVGTYEGTLPCADCAGIEVKLELNEDMSYTKTQRYLETETPNKVEEEGTFQWKEVNNIVILEDPSGQQHQYIVESDRLIALKEDGTKVTGEMSDKYILYRK